MAAAMPQTTVVQLPYCASDDDKEFGADQRMVEKTWSMIYRLRNNGEEPEFGVFYRQSRADFDEAFKHAAATAIAAIEAFAEQIMRYDPDGYSFAAKHACVLSDPIYKKRVVEAFQSAFGQHRSMRFTTLAMRNAEVEKNSEFLLTHDFAIRGGGCYVFTSVSSGSSASTAD